MTGTLTTLAVGICMLACGLVGISMGLATGKAVESVARQPEAQSKITATLVLGLALAESTAIYALVVALIMLFTKS